MKRFSVVLAVCVVLFVGVSGCKQAKNDAPPAQPAVEMAPPISGKIVETMNSGGYTYVFLENNGQRVWVAMPQTKVKVGQVVTCQPGMVMNNFTSKTLKRTFDTIVFSGGLS